MHEHVEVDWTAVGPHLEREAQLRAGQVADIAAWVAGIHGGVVRRVLDVGCGPGVVATQLARMFPAAEVVAADGEPALLTLAADRAAREGLADRVRPQRVDLSDAGAVAHLGAADVVWAGHVVHHLPDQVAGLRLLQGLLRPGGLLALLEGGLPTRMLPSATGRGLQGRLDVAAQGWFERMRESLPAVVDDAEDWPGLLRRAGAREVHTRSFLLDLPAPLDGAGRAAVHSELERLREVTAGRIADDDAAVLDRLLDPDAPDGVAHRPDVFLLSVDTVHAARA